MNYTILEALEDCRKGILKAKFLILAFAIIAAAGGWVYTSFVPTSYIAKSIFYPDKDASLSGSPLELITGNVTAKAGALGILAKVLNSRSMTKLVVSHPVDSSDKSKILADLIIDDYNLNYKPWQTKEYAKNFSPRNKLERAASIIRNGSFAVLDESGFMSLNTKANNKDLALKINKIIIQELIRFNFDKRTEKALSDLKFINFRTDSVEKVYESLKYQSANYSDENKYLIKATVKIPQEDMDEQKKIISSRYLKLIELQEQAFIRLQTDKPVVQILDPPYIESSTAPSKNGAAVVYGLIGLIFGFSFAIRKPVIKLVTNEVKRSIKNVTSPKVNEEEEDANSTPKKSDSVEL